MTMVIDKGLGLNETKDLFTVAGDYIDFLKLGFGTSALYNRVCWKKNKLAKCFGIDIYLAGLFSKSPLCRTN